MPGDAVADRWLIDTNILLRWVRQNDRDYSVVSSSIEALLLRGMTLCYTSQNVGEFWNACTRPSDKNGYGLEPEQADLEALQFESRLTLLPDSLAVHQEWRRMIVSYCVAGAQVHDARLAAAMRVHGVGQILTFNARDFARYSGFVAFHPEQVARLS